MNLINEPMPIYEALLLLAEDDEKRAILDGGEREKLSAKLIYGDGWDGKEKANRAYDAIESIIARAKTENNLKLTGIDIRLIPPKRVNVDWELLISGHLRWRNTDGIESELELAWTEAAPLRIINLSIEPREASPPRIITTMHPSVKLEPGERKNDNDRLALMQTFIDEGMPRKTAARKVAAKMPDPPTSEESVTTRLNNKYKKRSET